MKKSTIIILIIILILFGFFGLYIILQKTGPQGSGEEDGGGSFISNLFLFGEDGGVNSGRPPSPTENTDGGSNDVLIGNGSDALQQLTNVHIVGYIATTTGASTSESVLVRYMDTHQGNIYEIDIETLESKRITNTTLPGVREMIWHRDAENYILRYVDENEVVKTYVGTIDRSLGTSTGSELAALIGTFIDEDIPQAKVNNDNTKILYLKDDGRGGSIADASVFDSNRFNDETYFTSSFSDWNVVWVNNDTLLVVTKPSGTVPGYAYFVDKEDGLFKKILGERLGMTAISNKTGEAIVYSFSAENNFASGIKRISDDLELPLSVNTLMDKCSWGPDRLNILYCGVPNNIPNGNYPDDWYKGNVSFSDDIWKIDIKNNIVKQISSPSRLAGTEIDVIEPSVSVDGKYFLFKNKKDSTLWRLRLEN